MKRFNLLFWAYFLRVLVLWSFIVTAHSASAIAHGSFPVKVVKTLDSSKLKEGDSFEVETAGSFKLADGTLVPKGSKILGHIAASKARSKGDPDSQLALAFDKLNISGGKQMSLKGEVQAVFPPAGGAHGTEYVDGWYVPRWQRARLGGRWRWCEPGRCWSYRLKEWFRALSRLLWRRAWWIRRLPAFRACMICPWQAEYSTSNGKNVKPSGGYLNYSERRGLGLFRAELKTLRPAGSSPLKKLVHLTFEVIFMKQLAIVASGLLVYTILCYGQTSSSTAAPSPIGHGSFPVKVTKTLDSSKLRERRHC